MPRAATHYRCALPSLQHNPAGNDPNSFGENLAWVSEVTQLTAARLQLPQARPAARQPCWFCTAGRL